MQKKATAIPEDKVDWKQLEIIGVTQGEIGGERTVGETSQLAKSDLVTIAVKAGNLDHLHRCSCSLRTNEEGVGLAIHNIRKEPKLDFPYLGYKFSDEEKKLHTDHG